MFLFLVFDSFTKVSYKFLGISRSDEAQGNSIIYRRRASYITLQLITTSIWNWKFDISVHVDAQQVYLMMQQFNQIQSKIQLLHNLLRCWHCGETTCTLYLVILYLSGRLSHFNSNEMIYKKNNKEREKPYQNFNGFPQKNQVEMAYGHTIDNLTVSIIF